MPDTPTLFEVSFDPAAARAAGGAGVVVAPWRGGTVPGFVEEAPCDAADAAFAEACRARGVAVRWARAEAEGRPRTLLVDASALASRKDALLRHLWDAHGVDSLFGGADYVEAVLFGHAAGIALEAWWRARGAGSAGVAARFHGWTAGAGLLHVRERAPAVGTVFATNGGGPGPGHAVPAGRTDESRRSLEAAATRAADVVVRAAGGGGGDALGAALERARPRALEAALPAPLAGLARLARNFWWSWDADATALFEQLDPPRWESSGHDPLALLAGADAATLAARAADPAYAARVAATLARLDAYLANVPADGPSDRAAGEPLSAATPVAYFCAEFGVHESLRVYSGGLGVLAGDHLKSASDLGLPLVAVGLLYRKGYLRQSVSATGEQVPVPIDDDPRAQALELVRGEDGRPVSATVPLAGGTVTLVGWRAAVGRRALYLLDADLPENRAEDRAITHQLYGGDAELRLRQELVLGRGGVRFLEALGLRPAAIHLNEGHAAFAPLERVAGLVRGGLRFDEAAEVVRATTAFTTHTPVPAGHDRFAEDLVRRHVPDAEAWLGVAWDRFFALGRAGDDRASFDMTRLALRLSAFRNAVSRVHEGVSRRLLANAWPALLETEAPITHVTNGVHLPTWTAPEVARLVGAEARGVEGDDFARRAPGLDPAALWRARAEGRRRLLALVTRRARDGVAEGSERALWLGFARRFATYKRADLLLSDLPRLEALLGSARRPVRLVVAGKAHPKDEPAQALLRRVVEASLRPGLSGRLLFLEDHDVALSRALVQGVDAWLNLPLRGLEASGTSGMKAAANGGLNVSVRDGWWAEAFDGEGGWAVGPADPPPSRAEEDAADAASLFALLEREVVPLFFDRDADGVPVAWLERAKRSLEVLPLRFGAHRMVREYRDRAYLPLARAGMALAREGHAAARAAAARRERVRGGFAAVRVVAVRGLPSNPGPWPPPETSADVELGALSADDVLVEVVARDGRSPAVLDVLVPAGEPKGAVRTFAAPPPPRAVVLADVCVRVRARPQHARDDADADLVAWSPTL